MSDELDYNLNLINLMKTKTNLHDYFFFKSVALECLLKSRKFYCKGYRVRLS